ncbi:MAG: sigma-54 dependent transcriptional regulator [Desulfosarcinaceae bacterium]|nr:sigma-54 dependent transcriptional regulator [Desulfosarcinaceae bacterium]
MKTAHRWAVLIIDDEAIMRESISVYLEDSGYTVSEAVDGPSGLERFAAHPPDLVLLDLRMPGMDGLEVLSELAQRDPDVPVIVVTGAGGMQDAVAALRLGAFDFIAKPIIDMAVLENAVRRGLDQRNLVHENRRYREGLEAAVTERTKALRERTGQLEETNQRLQAEITKGHQMAEALRHSEGRLREVIALFEGFIYTVDADYRIEFMNRRLAETIGRDATGEACYAAIYQGSGPCTWCPNMAVFGGQTQRYEFCRPTDAVSPERWFYAIHTPMGAAAGRAVRAQIIVMDITDRKQTEESLKRSEAELRAQTDRLRSSLKGRLRFGEIVGKSAAMQTVYTNILKAAESSANVIVYGESGTGKELVARTIHDLSRRGGQRFVTVNCGAIPENLLESEFFGYRKGAFTGAQMDKPGFLDAAHQGTLFLDEIGELPLSMQVKLLRAIDGGGYSPIGSHAVITPDLRIIAATHRDLAAQMHQGLFRRDFYYRIHIIPVHLPPLRERRADIPLLAHHFLALFTEDGAPATLPDTVIQSMMRHDWPGNVRELQNAVHRYVTLKELPIPVSVPPPRESTQPTGHGLEGGPLTQALAADWPDAQSASPRLADVMRAFEKRYIERMLAAHHWHRSRVARRLGVDRRTLFRKIKAHGID